MLPFIEQRIGNPSSGHEYGLVVKAAADIRGDHDEHLLVGRAGEASQCLFRTAPFFIG